MKLLLDENLSPRLVESLADVYPGSAHVHALGLGGSDDGDVWALAREREFAIVTKDADFADRSVLQGAPPKVIWLRVGNCTTSEIENLLRASAESVRKFLEVDEETCLVLGRR